MPLEPRNAKHTAYASPCMFSRLERDVVLFLFVFFFRSDSGALRLASASLRPAVPGLRGTRLYKHEFV